MSSTFSFLIPVVLLLHALLSTVSGIPQCINPVTQPINLDDCRSLLNHVSGMPWYGAPVRYGQRQRSPGKLPKHLNNRSCQITIYTDPAYLGYETIILSSYQRRLAEIFNECLNSGSGFTAGLTNVGTQSVIFVYIGGVFLGSDSQKSPANLVHENTTLSMYSAV